MDIIFHYFAVKTLARIAGFSKADAQTIAEMSEYVDDYTPYAYQRHSGVPDVLKRAPYDVYMPGQAGKENSGYNFNPSTTGFASMFDYSTLTMASNQKNCVLPFHFLPDNMEQVEAGGRTKEARWHSGGSQDTIITQEMAQAADEYAHAADETIRTLCLIKIGMLLHIYADTCAHAGFSSYAREDNEVELESVQENISGRNCDVCSRFTERILQAQKGWVAKAIAVGHGFAGEAPDCTFVTWKIRRKHTGEVEPPVNNTVRFIAKGREILDYLRAVCGQASPIDNTEWAPIAACLKNAFLFDPAQPAGTQGFFEKVSPHWLGCFSEDSRVKDISYHYDAKQIFTSQVLTTGLLAVNLPEPVRTQFYGFVRATQDHLITLYGPRPRSGKSTLPQLNFTCNKAGENSFAIAAGSGGEGFVAINGDQDLSQIIKFNSGGCVFDIRVLKQGSGLFDWIIWVDAQGPSLTGGSGYLVFTDAAGSRYHLSIFRSARATHRLNYNSNDPAIVKIEWHN